MVTTLVARMRTTFEDAFRRSLDAVDPRAAVKAELAGREIRDPVTLVGIGKAAPAMAQGAVEVLGDRLIGGVVVSPGHHVAGSAQTGRAPAGPQPLPGLRYLEGGHPIPTRASLQAGRAVMIEAARATGTLLVLISGGASALAEVPLQGLTLADLVKTYRLLLRAGLPIDQINTVRRHLSGLKNGGLLGVTRADTVTLLIADVVGANAAAIGSGPTLADSSSPADALAIVDGAGILEALPEQVVDVLRGPARPQIPPPPHSWAIVTDGAAAARAAAERIRQLGVNAKVDPVPVSGDAAEQARLMARSTIPATVTVRHGETVVAVRGESPGGRNQHAALAAAIVLDGQEAVFAALATDGRDGLTESAGAIVDGGTCHRMRALAVDPEEMLTGCRSHEALAASGDLVVTGPTGTNVADIWMSWRPTE